MPVEKDDLFLSRSPAWPLSLPDFRLSPAVLRSKRAVQVNIAVMRAFVQLRQVLSSHAELARKLADLEQRIEGHDTAIRSLFDAIRQLMAPPPPEPPKPEIGFHVKEDAVPYRTKRRVTS